MNRPKSSTKKTSIMNVTSKNKITNKK